MKLRHVYHKVAKPALLESRADWRISGINLRWDYFVNAFDTHRYLPAGGIDARDNRHVQYVREFASVVSVLQVCSSSTCPILDNRVGQDKHAD